MNEAESGPPSGPFTGPAGPRRLLTHETIGRIGSYGRTSIVPASDPIKVRNLAQARAEHDSQHRRVRITLGIPMVPPGDSVLTMPQINRTSVLRSLTLGLLALVLCGLSISEAFAAPQPEAIPRRWEFDLRPGPLRVTTVEVEGVGPRAFFFMTYYVENNTGDDRFLAPRFELATDEGEIIRSGGAEVPREVIRSISALFRNELLEDEISILGPILQGRENAREGLVVWPANDLTVDEVTIYASGFSGETRQFVRPDNGEIVVLRKTRMLRHATPGNIDPNSDRPFRRTVDQWILR